MRSLHLLAAALIVGLMTAHASPTIGLGAGTGALNNGDYHMGYGVSGSVGNQGNDGMTEMSIKGNYLNYKAMDVGEDINEGGVGLTALVGPGTMFLQPKIGGHAGYVRLEESNYFDVGPDVALTWKMTPGVGIQAAVTPTWLINDNGNHYRTRGSLGVQWSPGV